MSPSQAEPSAPLPPAAPWPRRVADALWRGHQLGTPISQVLTSGWPTLDGELPGGGWPCRSLTEVLQACPGANEWRLFAPALRGLAEAGRCLAVVGPPWSPHLPGLQHQGLPPQQLIWVQADSAAERLWACEQLIRANACGALMAWLPQARPEELRRLQVNAQGHEGLVLLFRPAAAAQQASPAPLRLTLAHDADWALRVRVFKRRGAPHLHELRLPSVPGGLQAVLTPRMRSLGRSLPEPDRSRHVVGRPVATPRTTAEQRLGA